MNKKRLAGLRRRMRRLFSAPARAHATRTRPDQPARMPPAAHANHAPPAAARAAAAHGSRPVSVRHRAANTAARTATGAVWLLTLLAALILLGGVLIVSEGARTAVGFESIGQKIDRMIGRANGVVADAGESARDRATAVTDRVEHTGKQINDRSVAAFDAGAARVDAATGAVRERVDAAGTRISDAAITASIKTDLLKDPFLSALRVEVNTVQGEVTLTGEAGSEMSRERAARMAAAVAGVRRVNNRIAVTGATNAPTNVPTSAATST
jgi:osmotically-inducible protein OsmY